MSFKKNATIIGIVTLSLGIGIMSQATISAYEKNAVQVSDRNQT
ncbi:hypothetical protein [Bacillus sp. NPDC077027]